MSSPNWTAGVPRLLKQTVLSASRCTENLPSTGRFTDGRASRVAGAADRLVRSGEVAKLDVIGIAGQLRADLVKAVAGEYDDISVELIDSPRLGKSFHFRAVRSRR